MSFIINTNIEAISGLKNLQALDQSLATTTQRLSSGLRINSAKDDAAGLAVANGMTSKIRGTEVALRNASDGISIAQVAEGAMGNLVNTLQRMCDLAVQSSSNLGVSASDRAKMQVEFKALREEVLRIVKNTEFNGKKILNGELQNGLSIRIGDRGTHDDSIDIQIGDLEKLLRPVIKATLSPLDEPIDATLLAAVRGLTSDAVTFSQNGALARANKALVDARTAFANPNDLTLARDAANSILDAASFIGQSDLLSSASALKSNMDLAASTDESIARDMFRTASNLVTAAMKSANPVDFIKPSLDDAVLAAIQSTAQNEHGTNSNSDAVAQTKIAEYRIARTVARDAYAYDASKPEAENSNELAQSIKNDPTVVNATKETDVVATDFALASVNLIDNAISLLDSQRSSLGALQYRLTTSISNMHNHAENQIMARSRIMDSDYAAETASLSRFQILQRAGIAMLAQANQSNQSVNRLLRAI